MSSLTGNNFQTGQNLENISPVSTALNGINQRITGITYDGVTESTTISNNLIITDGKNLFINNYNVDARIDQLDADLNVVENSIIEIQNVNDAQNIDIDLLQSEMDTVQSDISVIENSIIDIQNVNDTQNTNISTLNTQTTGISYIIGTDTTQIDNNVIISTGKTLTLNGVDVTTRINALYTRTTGMSYVTSTDTTQFDNNIVISTGKTLTLNGSNVDTRITDLETKTSGQTYDSLTDTSTFDNNMVISTGKTLTLNGSNVNTRFNDLETKTTGITYNSGTTTTTISNPNIVLNGYIDAISNSINNVSNLYINSGGAVYIGGNAINTSALLTLNNTWTGTNSYNTYLPTSILTPTTETHLTTKLYVDTKISDLVNAAPTTLDTLNELAAALGDDPNFSTTITSLIGTKTTLSAVQSNNNVWSGSNSYNTYLPTSTLTPTNTTHLTTKAYVDTKTTLASVQANNNVWTGTNDFTANTCRVSTQTAPSLTTLAASCRFVQDSLDWFTSTSQVYTTASATQDFQGTNITCSTQSNSDNSLKVANTQYVNNKFTQFRTDNQTIGGAITFTQPPTSTNYLLLLEQTTRMPNSNWVLTNVSGEASVGVYTEFADFWNKGFSPGTTYDNQTFTADDRVYVVNTKTSGIGLLAYVVGTVTAAGHQGVIQFVVPGRSSGDNWCALNWNGAGTYSIHPFNMAFFECTLSNISGNTTNFGYSIWCGMTADSTAPIPNTFVGWRHGSDGFWRACYVLAGVLTDVTGSGYPATADPLVGRYMRLNVLFRVSGSTMDVTWSYRNNWTGDNGSFTVTGITNALGMMGPWMWVQTNANIQVDIAVDTWITKYYCNRG